MKRKKKLKLKSERLNWPLLKDQRIVLDADEVIKCMKFVDTPTSPTTPTP